MDPREVLSRPAPAPDRTLRYGGHPDQVIDVRGTGPVLAFLHGGFWRPEYDRTHTGPLAADLAGRGYTVATIEYRRTGWADLSADVAAAVTALPGLLGAPVAVLAGHSAGGHLALWAPFDGPVVALAPVAELLDAYTMDLDDGAVAALLGGSPTEWPDRYAEAQPGRVGLLVHGALDEQVPIGLSRSYAARTGSTLVEIADCEHFGLIDPLSAAWPTVVEAVTAASR